MASTSHFDDAQGATSEVSSVEDNASPQPNESCDPVHPRLSELKRHARLEAERQHKAVEFRKLSKGKDKRGRIAKSRRQTSNIRSAEICRAAKGTYIELLENEIRQEEESILHMWKEVLDQIAEKARISQRVARLEALCKAKEAQRLWPQTYHVENVVPEGVVDEFFLASGNDDAQWQWDNRKDGCSNAYDGDIELCDWDEDEWMDFCEVNTPVTPPPPAPLNLEIPVTPTKENESGIHCHVDKILLSPVTIADDESEPEDEPFVLMV